MRGRIEEGEMDLMRVGGGSDFLEKEVSHLQQRCRKQGKSKKKIEEKRRVQIAGAMRIQSFEVATKVVVLRQQRSLINNNASMDISYITRTPLNSFHIGV